jgi:hypothetical protein
MRKIEIELSEEQYQQIKNEISKGNTLNLQEETFSGYSLTLSSVEGGFAWLEFNMYDNIDIGDVNWSIS